MALALATQRQRSERAMKLRQLVLAPELIATPRCRRGVFAGRIGWRERAPMKYTGKATPGIFRKS
jgi:hypothetical protein